MGNECNDAAMAAIIMIIKNIMTVFQIVVPIILIFSASTAVAQLVINPEKFVDEKGKDHTFELIKNKVFSAIVIFFLPFFINLTVSMAVQAMGSDFSFSTCWESASKGQGVIQWVPGGQDIEAPATEEDEE